MNIAIYIYDNAEVLDFAGPFEVLSTAKRLVKNDWNIFIIGEKNSLITARGGFLVHPQHSFDSHPSIDILIVVGGIHNNEIKKAKVIYWVANTAKQATKVISVCTGAFILAEAGLLDNLTVTTHWEDTEDLRACYPTLNVITDQRWVAQDKFITSGGISAGIDMSLYLVSQLESIELAEKTANQMEYHWQRSP